MNIMSHIFDIIIKNI